MSDAPYSLSRHSALPSTRLCVQESMHGQGVVHPPLGQKMTSRLGVGVKHLLPSPVIAAICSLTTSHAREVISARKLTFLWALEKSYVSVFTSIGISQSSLLPCGVKALWWLPRGVLVEGARDTACL